MKRTSNPLSEFLEEVFNGFKKLPLIFLFLDRAEHYERSNHHARYNVD
jgi:hypothetical protein